MADRESGALISALPATREQWLSFCNHCPGTTFFHTPYWTDLFVRNYPRRFSDATIAFAFQDGATALLPMVIKRHLCGLVRIACSMPAGTFGGWLSAAPLRVEQEEEILRHPGIQVDCMLRENPYRPLQAPPGHFRCREDHTRTIDLAAGYDAAWKRSTAGHRNAVRNAACSLQGRSSVP